MASEIVDAWEAMQKANDTLRAENARFHAQARTLAKYARHLDNCSAYRPYPTGTPCPCSCGFDEANRE